MPGGNNPLTTTRLRLATHARAPAPAHPSSITQVELPLALFGEQAPFVQPDLVVALQTYQGAPASLSVPPKVAMEVAEVTPLAVGSAKENRDVPAVTTNGFRLKVPKHTKPGDIILVDTRSETIGTYLGKA